MSQYMDLSHIHKSMIFKEPVSLTKAGNQIFKTFPFTPASELEDTAMPAKKIKSPKIKIKPVAEPPSPTDEGFWLDTTFLPSVEVVEPEKPTDTYNDIKSSPSVEQFPASVEDKVMDILRHSRSNLSWSFSSDSAIRTQAARQLVMDVVEQIIDVFLTAHKFDKVAAAIAFYDGLKQYSYTLQHSGGMNRDQLLRNPGNIKYYFKDIDPALEKTLMATPFTPANLRAYLTALSARVKDISGNRRKKQPKIIVPAKVPYGE